MHRYRSDDVRVRTKSDASPVTDADLAADRVIFSGLRKSFPDAAIVTEERPDTHDSAGSSFFLVDPLDGTRSFVEGSGDFTVNIGFVRNGIPVFGVVYAPVSAALYCTRPDGTAVRQWIRGGEDRAAGLAGTTMSVAPPDNTGLIVVASRSHRNRETNDYIARYPVRETKAAGSSLKFCLVASGDADLYPRLGPTMEWDTAAGHAVLAAAGGSVVDLERQEPLTYGKRDNRNPWFVAFSCGVVLR